MISRVEAGQGVDHRREHRHRRGVDGEALEVVLERLVQRGVARQPLAEPVELGLVGQPAEDQEPGGLDEGGVLGELLDGDAAVAEDALLAVDEGDRARAGAGVAEAGVEGDQAGLGRGAREMSMASSPSVPSMTGSSIVRPSNVKVAVRVIATVSRAVGQASIQMNRWNLRARVLLHPRLDDGE